MKQNYLKGGRWTSFCLFLIAVCLCPVISAQSYQVSGIVKDREGVELIGVNVMEEGTTNGSVTDLSGRFSLSVKGPSSILNITYIGYEKQTITVGNRREIIVVMSEEMNEIDELVVVAYGTKKKRDMIGSVVKVKADEITALSSGGDFRLALQGKAAGLQVVSSGITGEDPR
ncbi:MAG: carboxypeptidase-like regulatory domain-containing protein [Bacteroides sp.]|nr:carboxypeptidase-like regulatory domain-containing protein [Bacteroides sp.]